MPWPEATPALDLINDNRAMRLKAAGCIKIYREKASVAQPDRRELLRMLKDMAPGDVVTVTRIDRLARSTFDLFAMPSISTPAVHQTHAAGVPEYRQ